MRISILLFFLSILSLSAQDYFTERYKPFLSSIESPEKFLEYEIGEQHTRHDQIVSYFQKLAFSSQRAKMTYYGKTHEGRKLTFLIVSSKENLEKLDEIQKRHLEYAKGNLQSQPEIPIIINLALNFK